MNTHNETPPSPAPATDGSWKCPKCNRWQCHDHPYCCSEYDTGIPCDGKKPASPASGAGDGLAKRITDLSCEPPPYRGHDVHSSAAYREGAADMRAAAARLARSAYVTEKLGLRPLTPDDLAGPYVLRHRPESGAGDAGAIRAQNERPEWFGRAMEADRAGRKSAGLDIFFGEIDTLLSAGDFAAVDRLLASVPDGLSLTFLMGLLSITLPAAARLRNRDAIYGRAWDEVVKQERDPVRMLGGLWRWATIDAALSGVSPATPRPQPDPAKGWVPVTVSVWSDGKAAAGTVMVPTGDARHVCGASGFGLGPDDRCPRCEADRRAGDIARDKIAASCVPPPGVAAPEGT